LASGASGFFYSSESRKERLFGLATFFYSFGGPNWSVQIRDNWLAFDRSECFWFSSGLEDNGSDLDLDLPCDQNGDYQVLSLNGLVGEGSPPELQPVLPHELALLTSLKAIRLADNDIGGSLSDLVIPADLATLKLLRELNLSSNSLTGSIPSELGLMTGLEHLSLQHNLLEGDMPKEVCNLNLKTLVVDCETVTCSYSCGCTCSST
jgi:Leucine Rich Repeat